MSNAYVLSAAAEADLRDIIGHTRQRWGDAQVRTVIKQAITWSANWGRYDPR